MNQKCTRQKKTSGKDGGLEFLMRYQRETGSERERERKKEAKKKKKYKKYRSKDKNKKDILGKGESLGGKDRSHKDRIERIETLQG